MQLVTYLNVQIYVGTRRQCQSTYLPNNNRMCVYCVREISLQLNQENGKSYGTGFFGKVQI